MTPPSSPRPRLHRLAVLVVVCAVIAATFASASVIADTATDSESGELSVSGTIDTPERTVTIDGSEYTVSALATVDHGDALSVDAATSAGTDFDVYLYNADQQIELSESGTGSESMTFDTSAVDPGSYALALYIDGDYVDYIPVVVAGYDVAIDHPTTVETTESSVDITATTTATAVDSDPAGVEVVVWNETTVVRETASLEDDTYRATVSTDALAEGETYTVYAVAQGDDQIEGEPEPLGVSDPGTLEITGSESGDPGGGDDDDESSGPDDDTETAENTTNSSDSDNSTDENVTADDETANTTDQDNDTEPTESDNGTDDSVLSPTPEGNETGSDSDDAEAIPLRAPQLLAFALLLSGLGLRLRHRVR